MSKEAEVTALVRLATNKPTVICLNESFLDRSCPDIALEGYTQVGRKDREDNSGWGGVAVLAKVEVAGSVVLLDAPPLAERLWLTLHTNQGPYLLCAWYRPPASGDTSTIESFGREYNEHSRGVLGTLVLGDLNVHNRAWLRHSNRNSVEGRALEEECQGLGLRQLVRDPTRKEETTGNDYLLDLVLTNLENVECQVLPGVADHRLVTAKLQLTAPKELTLQRLVWDFGKANWTRLKELLAEERWDFLEVLQPDEGTEVLTAKLLEHLRACVPHRELAEKKRSHPWLTSRVLQLVEEKRAAAGTNQERAAAEACSEGILQEYRSYVQRVRIEMGQLKAGSKKWWIKSQELLQGKGKTCSIPALKSAQGEWETTAEGKAKLLAKTFSAKYVLPEEERNEYTTLNQHRLQPDWAVPSQHKALEVLTKLREESATGPDLLPTRLLHRCAAELAEPLHRLAERILETGRWPELWLQHWVIPLYKKKAVWNPGNYRGVHLTAQLAKCTERLLQHSFGGYLCSDEVSGCNQFAYKKQKGARDVLAFLTLTWILGFNSGKKFGLYCSDVSGAFDKVDTDRILAKLKALGVQGRWLTLFESWLRERPARVAVGGSFSDVLLLHDMLFQGTVWGPQLWNMFFADAQIPVRSKGFEEVVYADDANAFKEFPRSTANETVHKDTRDCQAEVHKWGKANRVTLDPTKESLHVICRTTPAGGNFKTLGVEVDGQLTMEAAVRNTVNEANWKLRTLARCTRFQGDSQMVLLYKARVLSYVEYRTAAVYHATDTTLRPLNNVQTNFLGRLGISELEALMEFNLAPLAARRDIAMLGVIHRAALRQGPAQLWKFFQLDGNLRRSPTRLAARRHQRQLVEHRKGRFLEILRRSALGLVGVYNLLPAEVVAEATVKDFQGELQRVLKERAVEGCEDWKETFSPRIPLWRHPLR